MAPSPIASEAVSLPDGIFRCPNCRSDVERLGPCAHCGFDLVTVDGVPLLVKERRSIDAAIAQAKAEGRSHWYDAPQDTQWTGPYRHHLRKRRHYVDGVLATFAPAIGHATTGLDLGCGDGGHLEWLKGHVTDLYASDYNLPRLVRARQRGCARCVFMADVTNYPARDNSFDVIFFNHVLEHIRDDRAALAEVYRILKPGGLLVLGVPNEGAWFWQLAYRLQPKARVLSDHIQFYTADSLAAKCRDAGFAVKEIKHIGWGVPHWGLDERLRQFKPVDDVFEWLGRLAFRNQATSLYLALGK